VRATGAQELVEAGRAALARGAWASAREFFAQATAIEATPAAYEGLGVAARYQLDSDAAFAAHEEGYRLARAAGDPDTAAQLAVQLGYDAYAFRGVAEAVGWAERAAMLIEGRAPSLAGAYVPFVRAYMALLAQHDPPTAISGASEAVRVAREVGAVDVELLAVALGGLALVASGRVTDGMARLDAAAAAAIGGEMTDADSIETVCCFVIDACKRVRDLERANEWCLRVREIARRFSDRQMFTVCRVHYADVLLWRGDLADAEIELDAAVAELGRLRPGRDADAIVRLAELRRRQGRASEASLLLERARTHRLQPLVEGALALERGDATAASEAADRFLRRIGQTDRFERVAGLELQVRARLAIGDAASATIAADELDALSAAGTNPALHAAALLAHARLAGASGDGAAGARLAYDAADLFDVAGAR
jgi:LuxR family transcriptional regulator, maltose regulon positive regulatory protein